MQEVYMKCPCHSGKLYAQCCQKYHQGVIPEQPLDLMRSRYSAYALGIAQYLIETTHAQSPHRMTDQKQWIRQIAAFSSQTSFDGLEILETDGSTEEAHVSFTAFLSKEGVDLTFSERSLFLKEGHLWKYVSGKIAKGHLTAEQLR